MAHGTAVKILLLPAEADPSSLARGRMRGMACPGARVSAGRRGGQRPLLTTRSGRALLAILSLAEQPSDMLSVERAGLRPAGREDRHAHAAIGASVPHEPRTGPWVAKCNEDCARGRCPSRHEAIRRSSRIQNRQALQSIGGPP